MSIIQFDRDSLAKWYATRDLDTDLALEAVYYLPTNAGEREIRLIEVNREFADRTDDALTPIDFGVDSGTNEEHRLVFLDVSPDQWKRIELGQITLPENWSLDGAILFTR